NGQPGTVAPDIGWRSHRASFRSGIMYAIVLDALPAHLLRRSRQDVAETADQMEIFTAAGFAALLKVIAIDLVLAGDNAIVIGLAAAGLPAEQRKKAILIGVIAATVLRIAFAAVTVQLLAIVGLLLAGGLLL